MEKMEHSAAREAPKAAGDTRGEAAGIVPYVPVMRTVNNQGDGTLFGRADPSPMNRTAIPISVLATRGCRARIRIIKIVT